MAVVGLKDRRSTNRTRISAKRRPGFKSRLITIDRAICGF